MIRIGNAYFYGYYSTASLSTEYGKNRRKFISSYTCQYPTTLEINDILTKANK